MIAQGVARVAGRLRRDAAGELRRHHGADRGLRAAAGRLLRGQLAGGRRRRDAGGRGRDHRAAGASRSRVAEMTTLAQDVGETDAVLPHRRRAVAGARAWRTSSRSSGGGAGGDRLLVSLRHHVRGAVHPDDPRRRHARRPLHAAGSAGACLEAAGPHELDAGSDRRRARWSSAPGAIS